MTRIMKFLGLGSLMAGVIIQFYPEVERDNPPVTGDIDAPAEVARVLQSSCYDCHSNQTRWPWYSHVAPMSWLVTYDVKEARSRMNFSTWSKDIPSSYQGFFINRIVERVEKGEMPPLRYMLLHPSARVDVEDLEVLRRWRIDKEKGGP